MSKQHVPQNQFSKNTHARVVTKNIWRVSRCTDHRRRGHRLPLYHPH